MDYIIHCVCVRLVQASLTKPLLFSRRQLTDKQAVPTYKLNNTNSSLVCTCLPPSLSVSWSLAPVWLIFDPCLFLSSLAPVMLIEIDLKVKLRLWLLMCLLWDNTYTQKKHMALPPPSFKCCFSIFLLPSYPGVGFYPWFNFESEILFP